MTMSWRRAKSPGWAAFDLKQRQKQVLELEANNEPYPPISSTVSPLHPCQNSVQNNDLSVRSFSSILLPPVNFPTLTDTKDLEKPLEVGNSSRKQSNDVIEVNDVVQAYKKLKKLHCWADESLIEDIMAAVDNDIDKASALLEVMVSSGSFEGNKEIEIADLKLNSQDFISDNNTLPADKVVSLGETTDLSELSYVFEDRLNYKNKEQIDYHASYGERLSDDAAHMKLMLGNLRSIPVEPEWEEDDIYLIHRKDAIMMMRSASQHSRAATEAYLRGDHFSAQHFSLKAREEWIAAERLNAKAAKEILSIRNCKNNEWKLDLHGLHAAEAVQVLQEHLQKIESQAPLNRSVSPNRLNTKAGISRSASLESISCLDMEKSDKQQPSSRQRPTSLQVITGRGNHSRGQAALPAAIKSFLSEKRYCYDEARPGVITVQPKFRR
uniref:Smr domain-containing protein n=1 Tax=Davidia involucrata TaxID=16924 RepID=A0A5B7BAY7_DAVIN